MGRMGHLAPRQTRESWAKISQRVIWWYELLQEMEQMGEHRREQQEGGLLDKPTRSWQNLRTL